ncbi:Ral GTPase-activating protein subunit alpha-2 [Kappamyces sp. JEL0680]|nr:Ral GTPase-activating protein subunit alpha-2 [Kappamyces sp. JEL0680]
MDLGHLNPFREPNEEEQEQKRFDKLLKRLKPLFDEKLKLKQRLRGLQSFLERQVTTASKDASHFMELMDILGKILKYCADKINDGWERVRVVAILESVVFRGNHVKVRQKGLWILHQLISRQDTVDQDILKLYSGAVSWDVFKPPSCHDPGFASALGGDEAGPVAAYLASGQSLWTKTAAPAPVPETPNAAVPPNSAIIAREGNEAANNLELFGDLISNIIELCQRLARNAHFTDYGNADLERVLETADAAVLRKMWTVFRDNYLSVLFPGIARAIGLAVPDGAGFELCPLELLAPLLEFVGRISTYAKLSDQSSIKDTTNGLLSVLLGKDLVNSEFVHEMLRQGFLCQSIGPPLYIISLWLNSTHGDGHPFLRRSSKEKLLIRTFASAKSLNNLNANEPPSPATPAKRSDYLINQMIRRYIRYFNQTFPGPKKEIPVLEQLFKEILQFYRFLACEKAHLLDEASWKLLMVTVADLHLVIPLSELEANDFPYVFTETVLIMWIRSRNNSDEMWLKLHQTIGSLLEISGVATAWAALLTQVTYVMSEVTYGIGIAALKEDHGRHKKAKRNREQSTTNLLTPGPDTTKTKKGDEPPSNLAETSSRPSLGRSSTSKASSFSEHASLDDGYIDSIPGMQMMADSLQFSQIKELRELEGVSFLLVWKNLICVIGKPHLIHTSLIHHEITNCYANVWSLLDKIRLLQPYAGVEMPSLFDFAGMFMKTATMPAEYAKGASVAVGALGKMICRRHDQPIDKALYIHFYTLIFKSLSEPLGLVAFSLLSNISRLFSLCLPGATCLIPTMLKCIDQISTMKGVPEQAVRASIGLHGSLIAYEKHYRALIKYPQRDDIGEDEIIAYNPPATAKGPEVFRDLKFGIFNNLKKMLQFHIEQDNEDYCELILWTLSVFYIEECLSNNDDASSILQNDIIFVLLDQISSKQLPRVSAAADGLCLIANNFQRIKIPDDTLIHIIDRLAWGISENLSIDENTKRKDLVSLVSISSLLFQCLLGWLMEIPSKIVSNPNIALRITEVIEEAIHVSAVGIEGIEAEKTLMRPEAGDIFATNKQEYNEMVKIYQHLRNSAENMLLHVNHHLDNYSPFCGPSMMNSTIGDPLSEDGQEHYSCQYFSISDAILLAIMEYPEEKKVRILVRNATGKYVWDMKTFYHDLDELNHSHLCTETSVGYPAKLPRLPSKMTAMSSDSLGEAGSDPLEQTVLKIQKVHPECLYLAPDVESPASPETEFQQLMHMQVDRELEICTQRMPLAAMKEAPSSQDFYRKAFEYARLFIAQSGQLQFDHLKDGKFQMLAKTPSLLRDLRGLDKQYSREVAKFALLYVGPGQEDEGSILRNSSGSIEYDSFVASLGWEVDLATHTGYTGGLEPNMVNGGRAIYYCSSTTEMIFHDVTRMPTDTTDAKQLRKKRHIGNDHVHIVWNEHHRDYRWETIGGDFGNAQICITPLPNGLYAIDTYRDELVRPFGPLQSRSVVSKDFLGSLVRETAMNGYRNALCAGAPKGMEAHPFTTRKATIAIISGRHRIPNDTYERFVAAVFTEAMDLKLTQRREDERTVMAAGE